MEKPRGDMERGDKEKGDKEKHKIITNMMYGIKIL